MEEVYPGVIPLWVLGLEVTRLWVSLTSSFKKPKHFLDGLRASAMSAMSMGVADDEVKSWKFFLTEKKIQLVKLREQRSS